MPHCRGKPLRHGIGIVIEERQYPALRLRQAEIAFLPRAYRAGGNDAYRSLSLELRKGLSVKRGIREYYDLKTLELKVLTFLYASG